MITLFQFKPALGLPNASPFCMKMETYLRMANLEYSSAYIKNPAKGPKGKLPYIEDKGEVIADTRFIIEYLENTYNHDLDSSLNSTEKAVSEAFMRMLEELFYWTIVYNRWIDDRYWPDVKKIFFSDFPPLVKNMVSNILRKQVKRRLYEQGIGRHTSGEIYQIAESNLAALSNYLDDKPYFMGSEPTKLDATAYAFLANILQAELDSELKDIAMKYENLSTYCKRMQQQYYTQ